MTVKIEIFGENAKDALVELRDLSFGLHGNPATAFARPAAPSVSDESGQSAGFVVTGDVEVQSGGTTQSSGAGETPKRERGKPAPGRARRTKEEIAEDEAADKAEAEYRAAMNAADPNPPAEQKLSISSDPENRVGPEDEPETQEQDKADEQAEVEASRDAEAPLTGEDVRNAMGLYVKKFGMPAAQEDGASIFLSALGEPPKGAEGWKLSVVAEQDQPTIRKAVDAWTAAANAEARYAAKGGA